MLADENNKETVISFPHKKINLKDCWYMAADSVNFEEIT